MFQISKGFENPGLLLDYIDLIWTEWSNDFFDFTEYKTKSALYDYISNFKENEIQCVYILHKDNIIIGGCLIDIEDMGVHPEKSPWLANVIIASSYRQHGYASILLEYVVAKYSTLHLWTFTERLADFYKRFGFVVKEYISNHGHYDEIIYMIKEYETNSK